MNYPRTSGRGEGGGVITEQFSLGGPEFVTEL